MGVKGSFRDGPQPAEFRPRLRLVLAIACLVILALTARLWYLQVIRGEELRHRSENNAVRLRAVQPLRGLIMDRRGEVLVDNRASFDVLAMPARDFQPQMIVQKVQEIYKTKSLEFVPDQPVPTAIKTHLPVRLEKNVDLDKVALIETNSIDLPGVYIGVTPVRLYVDGEAIAPIVGYTGEVSKDELDYGKGDLLPGDITGKTGLEKILDHYIRGRRGNELIEVNAFGRVIKNLGRIDPVSGADVVLTIDANLQRASWEAFASLAGAAVAMDPRDGSILAMVSAPSFDPNLFNSGIARDQWNQLQNNPLKPLSNRAISGQYPPGSTYKMIVAAAALEEGIITPETKVHCNGTFVLGGRAYRCWKKHGHGPVNLHRALVESCDVYFYTVGRMLGVDKIAQYAEKFGLGDLTGIELPHERRGLVPTKEWKLARMKEPWQHGETISISIGQGFNLTTPLQLVQAYSALANGGTRWRPRLVQRVVSPEGKVLKEFFPEKTGEVHLNQKTMTLLGQALWGVVNEPGGTGAAVRRCDADVCGKTGTSQVVGLPQSEKARREIKLADFHKDHALFVCYAPMKNPEIAVAVIAENAGGGGAVAAPIARKILDAYFEGKKQQQSASLAGKGAPAGI